MEVRQDESGLHLLQRLGVVVNGTAAVQPSAEEHVILLKLERAIAECRHALRGHVNSEYFIREVLKRGMISSKPHAPKGG